MNTKKTVIAASIAALLAAPVAAFAKDQWEYHEDQWGNVVSYGSVQLAQDSSEAWGPWAEFIMPAAGGPVINPVQFVGEGGGERYRPEPKIVPPVVPPIVSSGCEAGTVCGYAVFRDYSATGYSGDYEGRRYTTSRDGGEHPATFTARIPPVLDDSATTAWRVTSLDGTAPVHYAESGELGDPTFLDNYFSFYRGDGSYDYNSLLDGAEGGAYLGGNVPDSNIPVARGNFGRWMETYIRGDSCDDECYYTRNEYTRTDGIFVAGGVTSATDMSALRANNITAVYNGYAFYNGTPVAINVNFGTASWSGSWNNGADGSIGTYTPSGSSQQYVYGRVGFNASGTISGSNIQSTSVSATDGAVSGSVKGSFYGSQAAALGGVVDITKTTEGYTNARHVDLYLTTKQQ